MQAQPAHLQDLLPRLAKHRALANAPVHEHAWLVAHGELQTYAAGEVIIRKGEQAKTMFVLLDGHIVIRADSGVGAHKIFEWKGGDLGGTMPYSRRAVPPNDSIAEEATEFLAVAREHFPK